MQVIEKTFGTKLDKMGTIFSKENYDCIQDFIYFILSFRRIVKVLVYGSHSDDWMTALAPNAPVWSLLSEVRDVVNIACEGPQRASVAGKASRDTVIIPLLESHILNRPHGYASLAPRNAAVTMLRNKGQFARYLRDKGFEHLAPHTTHNSLESRFPCVVKRADLNGSNGVTIVRGPDELSAVMRQDPWCGQDVIFQELVPGDTEAVTHCVCFRGRVVWHASVQYLMDRTEKIRRPYDDAVLRVVETPKAAIRAIETILRPLDYNGPCNIDYKVVAPDCVAIFELNPRLGGGLMRPECVALLAGALRTVIRYARLTPP